MLSTGSFNFIPYSLSGLQNVNADTINGITPFNGVIANTNYPLSFDSSTGILSQTPIGQSVETTANPSFNRINLTGTPAITTTSTTLHIRPAGFTTRFNNDGTHGFVEIECIGTSTSGQVLFYTKEGTLRALMRADTSYFYFFNLASSVGCVYYTIGGVVFYCSFGQATGTGEIVFKDNNIEVFTANAVNGLTMKNSNRIQSVAGTNLILNAPTGQQINFNINNTNKFYVNSSGIYAISLPSATQTNILGYDTSTGQITYQLPPSVPLSITVNNIASDSSNDLSLSSANNNINITAMSAIGGTGAGNINIYYKRYLSFYYDSSSVEIIRFQSTGIIFPNQTTTGATETPIRFTSTGPSYIQNNLGPVGFTCGGNNILNINGTTSTGTINAIINNVNILKVSLADGLTTNKITSNATTDFILNAPTGQKIQFNINSSQICFINQYGLISTNTIFSDVFKYYSGTVNLSIISALGKAIDFIAGSSLIASLDNSGFFINQIYSQAGQDLRLDAQTGIIQTSSSFTMYGGNLNLFDYSTGLIQSQLFTDNITGLNITSPIDMILKTSNSTNKINFKVGTATIAYVNSTGMTLETNLNINSSSSTTASIVLTNAVSAPKIQSTSSLYLQSSTSGTVLINNGTTTIATFGATSLYMTADIEMALGNILISYGYYQQFLTSSSSVKWKFKPSGTSMQVANSSGVGAEITNGATSWTAISDIRLKKNIEPFKN